MKRISMISEHASPLHYLGGADAGGQNVYVHNIAKYLADNGVAVDVFTRRDSRELDDVVRINDLYRVIHITAGPKRTIPKEEIFPYMSDFVANMLLFMEDEDTFYDLIHANFWMSGWVASLIKSRTGIPFVITFHALGKVRRSHQGNNDKFPDVRFVIEEKIVEQADAVIAECPQDQSDLESLYAADPHKIRIIPCGYDPEELHPVGKDSARQYLGLPLDRPIVLQLSRMVPRKGLDNGIRGFARHLQKAGDNALMMIVGGDSENPDPVLTPEIARLEAVAREEKIESNVIFFGSRRRESLKYYYSAADVFVTTPWYEPFGITPLEAMACGLPVIGSRTGGIMYSVVDGHTGYLVEPHDPNALGEKLSHLLSNPFLRKKMGTFGRRRVEKLFKWDHVGQQVLACYEDIGRARSRQSIVATS